LKTNALNRFKLLHMTQLESRHGQEVLRFSKTYSLVLGSI